MRSRGWKVIICLSLVSCGGGDDPAKSSEVILNGTTACERYASLASGLGCATPSGCMIEDACDSAAVAWINCAATDKRQCLCESDGDVNCEGSFKANEGPALCSAEYGAYNACSEN
jgi:hypothetical protein